MESILPLLHTISNLRKTIPLKYLIIFFSCKNTSPKVKNVIKQCCIRSKKADKGKAETLARVYIDSDPTHSEADKVRLRTLSTLYNFIFLTHDSGPDHNQDSGQRQRASGVQGSLPQLARGALGGQL